MGTETDNQEPWIGADEPPPLELVNAEGRGRVILRRDHASSRIPRRLGARGLSPWAQERHLAWV